MAKGIGVWWANDGRWYVKTRDGKAHAFARAVLEGTLKRELRSYEVVHHRNGFKSDDRPENLQLTTIHAHPRLHARMRAFERWIGKNEMGVYDEAPPIPDKQKKKRAPRRKYEPVGLFRFCKDY